MNIQIKSSNGITVVPIESSLLAHRKIFIEGEITSETGCDVSKEIITLNEADREKSIDIMINSSGGEVNAGLLILDMIRMSVAPVRMICIGKAYSMAAVIFAGGVHGRYMLPNSELMIHEPLIGENPGGTSSSIRSVSDSLIATKEKINQILSECTGRTSKEIDEAMKYDHYFNPEESIEFGLCNEIIGDIEVIL